VKRWPFTASNPVDGIISQRRMSSPVVSVFQIVSGACGNTSSTTMLCVSSFNATSFMDRFP
jgi:hypothetical protein